jgi:hypothetical protein
MNTLHCDKFWAWFFAVLWQPFWKRRQILSLIFCSIVVAILKKETSRNFSMSRINLGHHYLPTHQILMISDNVEFWKRRIAPLMVIYHYIKFYVSIIIHLEVININVRNFNFPIGFYSNFHPLWTPQNMTLTPFTTKLKILWPTRNIYL